MTLTLLTGRRPDVSSEIRKKFVRLCQEHGIVKENILDLTKTGKFSLLFLLQMIMEHRGEIHGNGVSSPTASPLVPRLVSQLLPSWLMNWGLVP